MKRVFIASVAGLVMVAGLAACGSEPEAPVETAPEAPDGISVTDGRMNLPAATGNPASVYFNVVNDGTEMQTMRSVHVAGAESAMFHETAEWEGRVDMQQLEQIPVMAGETAVFEPGGKHVMAFNLAEGMEPGGEVEVTITFVRGDKVSFPARLLAPGDDGSAN
ncbi:copper chaperone PCu(A)C [Altererythrobacter sp. KTW20L]|uniref:copper chaperone PCu(A)C n=1 Tax=Altererythrobacter sp. KTW20L TaxID=2942210 RepID=UPI0020BDC2E2|nr:copper chaperone PCu(A)C [Altererythrobacter sp. KTW20L]MCL6251046.1 copper chaperone PCu(A)C [Altererythrobacter sp. KTW20L]